MPATDAQIKAIRALNDRASKAEALISRLRELNQQIQALTTQRGTLQAELTQLRQEIDTALRSI